MNSQPILLDLFCGAGGATRGYQRAGFYVIGVDIKAQPDYCGDEFIQDDALGIAWQLMCERDITAIHASPPCQVFTRAKHLRKAQGGETRALDLLDPTRRLIRDLGVPYVIENVPGAPLYGVELCGSMFGLPVQRHRIFESNIYIPQPKCHHDTFPLDKKSGRPRPIGVYHVLADEVPKGGKTAESLEQAQAAMGIDWMPWDSLKESIPPAYTTYVGAALFTEMFPALAA